MNVSVNVSANALACHYQSERIGEDKPAYRYQPVTLE